MTSQAPAPTNQDARLQALHRHDILDSAPEKDFDDIVDLISRICDVPTSLVSFVDADRQWFKARIGFDECQTGLNKSICAWVVLEKALLEIEDTTKDPRTRDNPLVQAEGGIRFYAGAPLVTSDGLVLGSLCAIDSKPRKLTALQRDALTVLARQVVALMEARLHLRHAAILRQEIDHRTKNSLQSVSTLTRLQARASQNPEVRRALELVDLRIGTVALLHEALYRASQTDKIALAEFGARLGDLLSDSCPPGVSLAIALPDIVVGSQQGAALGTIIYEFVANALKHAFANVQTGRIDIAGRQETNGEVVIALSDDGDGMLAAQKSQTEGSGLGSQIIEASAMQLSGTYEVLPSDKGMMAVLTFHP